MDGDYETSFLTDSLILIPYADEKNDTIYVLHSRHKCSDRSMEV